MSEEIKWLEEMTEYLFKRYKDFFLKKIKNHNFKSQAIQKVSFLRNQYLDFYDEDDDDEVVVEYSLGIYNQAEIDTLGDKIDEWPSTIVEDIEELWGPPPINDAWENSYDHSTDFELFQHCSVLAIVAERLLNDVYIKPYLSNEVSVYIKIFGDFNEVCELPMFRAKVPTPAVRKKVINDFVTTEENKKLIFTLWNINIKGPGKELFTSLGMTPTPNYPSDSEISKVLFKARRASLCDEDNEESKVKAYTAAIEILKPFLNTIIPYKGKKTKKMEAAFKEHERACNYLGMWYNKLKDYDNAEKWWRVGYETLPIEASALNLCLVYKNNKPNYPEYLKIAQHLVSIFDDLSSYNQMYAWEYLASAYVLNGDLDNASDTFIKMIESKEEKVEYYEKLAKREFNRALKEGILENESKSKLVSLFNNA